MCGWLPNYLDGADTLLELETHDVDDIEEVEEEEEEPTFEGNVAHFCCILFSEVKFTPPTLVELIFIEQIRRVVSLN